jgi:hypothetical protein
MTRSELIRKLHLYFGKHNLEVTWGEVVDGSIDDLADFILSLHKVTAKKPKKETVDINDWGSTSEKAEQKPIVTWYICKCGECVGLSNGANIDLTNGEINCDKHGLIVGKGSPSPDSQKIEMPYVEYKTDFLDWARQVTNWINQHK